MEVNIFYDNDYYNIEKEFYKKAEIIMRKKFSKDNIDKCNVYLYYEQEKYSRNKSFKITTYKKSKNKKNQLVRKYNKDFMLTEKFFYSKNYKNYMHVLFDCNEKKKYKSFTINGEKTKSVYYLDNGLTLNTKYKLNVEDDDVRFNKNKLFLKTCNDIQYSLYFSKDKSDNKAFIVATKKGKEIKKFNMHFSRFFRPEDKIKKLIDSGSFRNYEAYEEYILDFDTCTATSTKEIQKRIIKEHEEKEKLKISYHTKILDTDFNSDTQIQFVNGYRVNYIDNYEFKIFVDENYKHRTLKGEKIHDLDAYISKCIANSGLSEKEKYEKRKQYGLLNKKKSSNNDYYESAGELLDEYIHEAFGGDEEAWEDYCEDIADYYDD